MDANKGRWGRLVEAVQNGTRRMLLQIGAGVSTAILTAVIVAMAMHMSDPNKHDTDEARNERREQLRQNALVLQKLQIDVAEIRANQRTLMQQMEKLQNQR